MKTTVVLLAVLVVTVIGLRAQEIRTPIAPIAPTDVKQCSALFEAWQPILRRLHDISFDCHRRNMFKELVRYGENGVTPRPCLGVAQQSYNAHREERRQVEGCYAAVRDYDKRENEREREEKAQQAAAAAAEREQQARREQLRRESEQMQNAFAKEQRDRTEAVRQHVADQQRREAEAAQRQREQTQNTLNTAMRDLASAKDAAAAYTAAAASVSHRNVDLTAGERHALDAMRRDADKGGLAPRYVPAEPTGSTVTNLSGLTGAVADLFGSEFESVVKWGLNKTETGAYMVDVYDTANDYAAKYRQLRRVGALWPVGLVRDRDLRRPRRRGDARDRVRERFRVCRNAGDRHSGQPDRERRRRRASGRTLPAADARRVRRSDDRRATGRRVEPARRDSGPVRFVLPPRSHS